MTSTKYILFFLNVAFFLIFFKIFNMLNFDPKQAGWLSFKKFVWIILFILLTMFLKQGKIEQKAINVFFFYFCFSQVFVQSDSVSKQGIPKLLFILQTLKCFETSFFLCFKRFFMFEILKTICFKKRNKRASPICISSVVWPACVKPGQLKNTDPVL